jgi:hypothetical protein
MNPILQVAGFDNMSGVLGDGFSEPIAFSIFDLFFKYHFAIVQVPPAVFFCTVEVESAEEDKKLQTALQVIQKSGSPLMGG